MKRWCGGLIAVCLLLATMNVDARATGNVAEGMDRVEGIALPRTLAVSESAWGLSGTHVSRWAGVFKVSVGALWLPAEARGRDVLADDVGKHLEIHYLVAIPGERLRDGTRALLARNLDAATLAREREGLDALVGAFSDVRAGDRYALTYVPGQGITLALNGRVVARVARDAVAAAMFAVWLGPSPLDLEKKRALLAYRHLPRELPRQPAP